jgi:hypothetical protein
LERLGRKEIREFLDWVHEDATSRQGINTGRTANKVRSHLRAIMSWAWEQDLVDALPRFPRLKPQRDVAGRHYLTKSEINALYFATHRMKRPRGWSYAFPIGRYWRSALVVFFNYGVDTGTIWKTLPFHEPILWRHLSWERRSPDREIKEMLALLTRWPHPRDLKRANPATLTKVLREAGLRNEGQCEALVSRIRNHKLLTRDNATHEAMAPLLKVECRMLRELDHGIEQFEKLIEAEMKTHQDAKLFTALPGAGKALAPRLLTAFGSNRDRFSTADEVASMSGIAPVTRQSGKSMQVVRRFACPNHLRQTFHEFANCARIWCPWSKAYYSLQRSRGMKHHAAIRKLAHRWIRILFQVWKTKTAYDPSRYLESVTRKNPLMIPFLPQPKNSPQTI